MRIAVIGTGGVGGYFGAQLAAKGHDVAFVARGAHLQAIRRGGLIVESQVAPRQLRDVVVTDQPGTLAPADAVMCCVKLWDLESVAAQIAPLLRNGGVVIPFQNGVEAHEILGRALGPARVLGGVAYIAATIKAPGVIAHTGTMAKLAVGAFETGQAAAAEAFQRACADAGIDASLAPDIRRALWEKFVFLVALSGATALARQPIGVIRADPDLRALFEAAMRETALVAQARGVTLPADFVAQRMTFADSLPAGMKASMLHDLEAGRRLEAPWLAGAVSRMAGETGLAAPVNATIYAALKPYLGGAAA
jgi:2-dehydropantoate 2-reductase